MWLFLISVDNYSGARNCLQRWIQPTYPSLYSITGTVAKPIQVSTDFLEVSCDEIFMVIDSSDFSFFAVFFHEPYTIPLSDISNIFFLSIPIENKKHPLEIQSKTWDEALTSSVNLSLILLCIISSMCKCCAYKCGTLGN